MAVMDSAAPRVLVVDDDPDVLSSLERGLRLSGFEVATAVDGAEALRSATENRPDAIVLDINMPVLDGVSVVTALRAMDNDVPVCVLSARSSVDDRVAGLEAGADDYLVKPFSAAQAMARIGAVLRRAAPSTPESTRVVVGGLVIDPVARTSALDGRPLDLNRKEFDLLLSLATRAGEVVSKRQLLAEVWQQPWGGADRTVDVHLSWLRRKLGESAAEPRYLHSVRGVGIKLVAPEPQS